MRKSILQIIPVLLAASLLAACNAPAGGLPTFDPTAALLTAQMYAGQTIAAAQTSQAAVTLLPEPTFTLGPTVTLGPTMTLASAATSIPQGPYVTVSIETNCRLGPGTMYDKVGSILPGEMAQIFGKDPTSQYWYIRNPDNAASYCWIIGTYATVNGSVAAIPVMTALPAPTATITTTPSGNFTYVFVGTDSCVGWYLEFNLTNNGTQIWESIKIQATDTTTATTLNNQNDKFEDLNGCLTGTSQQDLAPGESGKVASASFGYNPSGHDFSIIITLCAQNGLGAPCINRTLTLTVP